MWRVMVARYCAADYPHQGAQKQRKQILPLHDVQHAAAARASYQPVRLPRGSSTIEISLEDQMTESDVAMEIEMTVAQARTDVGHSMAGIKARTKRTVASR